MVTSNRATLSHPMAIFGGFLGGFFATLIFHQLAVALLWWLHLAPFPPYQMAPQPPFGVPAVFSLAFWGGVWGILFAYLTPYFGVGSRYWLKAFVFGAIFPTLVALLVVLPLKGKPVGAHWQLSIWTFALVVNGCWGLGTGVFLRVAQGLVPGTSRAPG
ncbi:hypothetical protein [Mangrovitalea sediminis]|uniref:hypothetical protein n=1 Tax=Mangrovitalea sediminis TaxID=1982043 RepID=UPI001D0D775B|nr:hypothetical protein [Mangrovitalea sediminis]